MKSRSEGREQTFGDCVIGAVFFREVDHGCPSKRQKLRRISGRCARADPQEVYAFLAEGWRDVAKAPDWLDGRESHEEDPHETPEDDPRQKTDAPNTKQTDEPWKGNPEKEQRNEGDIDLEKWQELNTH